MNLVEFYRGLGKSAGINAAGFAGVLPLLLNRAAQSHHEQAGRRFIKGVTDQLGDTLKGLPWGKIGLIGMPTLLGARLLSKSFSGGKNRQQQQPININIGGAGGGMPGRSATPMAFAKPELTGQ